MENLISKIMGSNPNHYLEANFSPVKEVLNATKLDVIGSVPRDLFGTYLRNGPNPKLQASPKKYHWFMGDGMVHGVRLEEGNALWYRNNYVVGEEFGPNTHVIEHAGKIYACVEAGPSPVELDSEINSLTNKPFQGTLKSGFSPHPKLDADTNELHAICYDYNGYKDYIQYVVVNSEGLVSKTKNISLPSRSMIHNTAITKNYILIFDLSVTFSLYRYIRGYFPFSWKDKHIARVGLLPRNGNQENIVWCEVNPCYSYHNFNSYETTNGSVVVNLVHYQRNFDQDWNDPFADSPPQWLRWTLNPNTGKTNEELVDSRAFEFPRIHPLLEGKNNRFGYSVVSGEEDGQPDCNRICKHDLKSGLVISHALDSGRLAGEPVFIPRENAKDEDAGYVMTFVYDGKTKKTELIILNAEEIEQEPLARVLLPQRVPFGFHGNWVPS
jgi:carotenoid cleavage dioxygenase